MRAAYYEKNGSTDVLHVGEVDTPQPGPGEVRVKLKTSGVNPSDVKTRAGSARKIAFPRVIPHSDGAGEIDAVGAGVPPSRIGERVWTWNAAWKKLPIAGAERGAGDEQRSMHLPDGATTGRNSTAGRRDVRPVDASMAWRTAFSRTADGIRPCKSISHAAETSQRQPLSVCVPARRPDRVLCLVDGAFAPLSDRAARLRAGSVEHAARDARPRPRLFPLAIGIGAPRCARVSRDLYRHGFVQRYEPTDHLARGLRPLRGCA